MTSHVGLGSAVLKPPVSIRVVTILVFWEIEVTIFFGKRVELTVNHLMPDDRELSIIPINCDISQKADCG